MAKISFETITSKDALAGYAITCIALLEAFAISQGINGISLTFVVGILGGLGGYYRGKSKPTK